MNDDPVEKYIEDRLIKVSQDYLSFLMKTQLELGMAIGVAIGMALSFLVWLVFTR